MISLYYSKMNISFYSYDTTVIKHYNNMINMKEIRIYRYDGLNDYGFDNMPSIFTVQLYLILPLHSSHIHVH